MLGGEGLTTERISGYVEALQRRLLDSGLFASAELLNPLDGGAHARFLAFRTPHAQRWCREFADRNCVVDVRGDVLRVGLALYHDEEDIDRFAGLAADLRD
jgi:selenocysteine lyase/cysteine desulfurase